MNRGSRRVFCALACRMKGCSRNTSPTLPVASANPCTGPRGPASGTPWGGPLPDGRRGIAPRDRPSPGRRTWRRPGARRRTTARASAVPVPVSRGNGGRSPRPCAIRVTAPTPAAMARSAPWYRLTMKPSPHANGSFTRSAPPTSSQAASQAFGANSLTSTVGATACGSRVRPTSTGRRVVAEAGPDRAGELGCRLRREAVVHDHVPVLEKVLGLLVGENLSAGHGWGPSGCRFGFGGSSRR